MELWAMVTKQCGTGLTKSNGRVLGCIRHQLGIFAL